mmetsp:Transcript_11213/g.12981  ORF Transcript_11213/g.12981 Transcript_11213/m.12981 type:complete len:881 (+) Transcript_11213:297-2939(+)|eukprot:CAMPEP_0184052342 /NCGR_PEP_ID=MMETSP0956-20121227/5243_1 /TAXON_ID=627963 /ORGANISM="Aplanochytrium sp, Strain PBS07" /LENGTH=880 /DNA_ID=CAMNT_0026345395 /DNA_START=289 /DNA_END=2931 /DNA_ORIENTATION=+
MAKVHFKEKVECWGKFQNHKHWERLVEDETGKNVKNKSLDWGEDNYEKIMEHLKKSLDESLLDRLFSDPRQCAKLVPPEYVELLLGKALLSNRLGFAKSIIRFTQKHPKFQGVRVSNEYNEEFERKLSKPAIHPNMLFLTLVRHGNVEVVRFALDNAPSDVSVNDVRIRNGDMRSIKWLDKELSEMTPEERFNNDLFQQIQISRADYEVETMLTAALKSGSREMVKHILHKGADPFKYDYQAFKVAAQLGLIEDLKYMLWTKKKEFQEKGKKFNKKNMNEVFSRCFAHAAMEDQKLMMTWLIEQMKSNENLKKQKVYQDAINLLIDYGSDEYCCNRYQIMFGITELLRAKDRMVASNGKKVKRHDSFGSASSLAVDSYEPADFVKLSQLYSWFKHVTKGHEFNSSQVVKDLFFLGLDKYFAPKVKKRKNQLGDEMNDGTVDMDNFSVSDASSLLDSWDNASDGGASQLSRISGRVSNTIETLRRGSVKSLSAMGGRLARKNNMASRQEKVEALGLAAEFGDEEILTKMMGLILPKDDKMLPYLRVATKNNKDATCKVLLERLGARIDELSLTSEAKGGREKKARKKSMRRSVVGSFRFEKKPSVMGMGKSDVAKMREALILEMENKEGNNNGDRKSLKGAKKSFHNPNTGTRRKSTMKKVKIRSMQKKDGTTNKYSGSLRDLYQKFLSQLLKDAVELENKLEVVEVLVNDRFTDSQECEKIITKKLLAAVTRNMKAISPIEIVTYIKLMAVNINKKRKRDGGKLLDLFALARRFCRKVQNSPIQNLSQLDGILKEITKHVGSRVIRFKDVKQYLQLANEAENNWTSLWGSYVYLLFENMEPNEQKKLKQISPQSVKDLSRDAYKAWNVIMDAVDKGKTEL